MALRVLVMIVLAVVVAAGNWLVAGDALGQAPAALSWLVGAPLVLGIAGAVLMPRPAPSVDVQPASPPPPPVEPPPTPALRLLAALQEEGRLVDFLQEDIGPYSDEQIGAAVRGIHEPCRKALRACVTIEPVLRGAEGDAVTVDPGFDPAAVRLVGNVAGTPPFHGVLRHAGWKVTAVRIPVRGGQDEQVLAPAEVELG
jgi:hypothetical protein